MRALTWAFVLLAVTRSPSVWAAADPPAPTPPDFTAPWPCFRGDDLHHGRRAGKVSDAPKLVWTLDVGCEVLSTAAIASGKVYVGASEGGLRCLDLNAPEKAGKEVWKAPVDARIESSPTVREGRVYFGDTSGVFHVHDAASGKEIWKFDTKDDEGGGAEIISSASFWQDRVLFGCYDEFLYCLAAADGKLVWKLKTQAPIHATPAVAEGKTFVAGCDEHLRTVDITAGKEMGELEMDGYSAGAPLVYGEQLFLGTSGCQVHGVDWKAPKIRWTYEHPDRKFPYASSPALGVLANGDAVVLIGGRDKMVHALRAADGKSVWTFATRAKVDASPVVVGSRVFAAGNDGNVYLLDLETGKEIWKYEAGAGFAASPAVGEGRLVITTDEGLVHCFDVRPPS
ncbi:MAG TPA: PQQ-binding-like beta-propeller repeat protein [Planctomycetota bacterium]|nr:PQQ-binding-like beta-propeller repeat protein [Planctomycetota bacterium]